MKDNDKITHPDISSVEIEDTTRQPFCFGLRRKGTVVLEDEDREAKTIKEVVTVINFVAAGQLIVQTKDGHLHWFNVEDWGSIKFTPDQERPKIRQMD